MNLEKTFQEQRLEFSSSEISQEVRIRLGSFVALLLQWNRSYSLIGSREGPRLWSRHVYDSLALQPLIRGKTGVDIGSGAGFPGLVLALADPKRPYFLIESSQKKALFLDHVKRRLSIDNLEIQNLRAEQLTHKTWVGPVTFMSRALGPLPYFLDVTASLCDREDQWLAMQGGSAPDEWLAPESRWHVTACWKVWIDGRDTRRYVLDLRL